MLSDLKCASAIYSAISIMIAGTTLTNGRQQNGKLIKIIQKKLKLSAKSQCNNGHIRRLAEHSPLQSCNHHHPRESVLCTTYLQVRLAQIGRHAEYKLVIWITVHRWQPVRGRATHQSVARLPVRGTGQTTIAVRFHLHFGLGTSSKSTGSRPFWLNQRHLGDVLVCHSVLCPSTKVQSNFINFQFNFEKFS